MRNSTIYKLAGPKTFRRSSTKILSKHGGNVQNVEKSMRAIYIPDGIDILNGKTVLDTTKQEIGGKLKYWIETGDTSIFTEEELSVIRVMLQVDQSGAEALIVAYDSVAGDYRQLFIHNVKPHVYVGLKLFLDKWKAKMHEAGGVKIDIDEINRTPISQLKLNPNWKELDLLIKDSDNWPLTERYYYLAKQTVHSANYDIQAATFRMNILEKSGGKIVISKQDSEFFLNMYRSLFPEIPESNRRIKQQVDKGKILFNMFGHPYIITNYNITEATYKEYFAWPRQSTVAEITRIAFSELQYYIEEANKPWDILQDNHDSILAQCPLLDVKECGTKMQELINQELTSPVDGVKFSMRSECQVGFNWSGEKKGIDDLGLRQLKW